MKYFLFTKKESNQRNSPPLPNPPLPLSHKPTLSEAGLSQVHTQRWVANAHELSFND